jgi:hypothetical protein
MKGVKNRIKSILILTFILFCAFIINPQAIPTAKAPTFFSEGFEPSPLPGWTSVGYWHLVDDAVDPCIGAPSHPSSSYSPTHSYAYHIDATCDYDDGGINGGFLNSPTIDLSGTSLAYLHFMTWFHVSAGASTDKMMVKISTDGSLWTQIAQISSDFGDPMAFWFEKTIDISSYTGDSSVWIRFEFDTITAVLNNGAGWYIDDIQVDDIPPPIDTLTIEAWNRAPATAETGQTEILMMQLNLTVDSNVATMTSLDIDLSGSPPTSDDIMSAVLYLDENGNGIFEPSYDDIKSGTTFSAAPCPCSGTFNIVGGLNIGAGTSMKLFIVFQIALSPTVGNWVGVSIADESYFTIDAPDIVASFGGIDTYVASEKTKIVSISSGTLMVEWWNRAPATAYANEKILMLQLNLTVDRNFADVNSITVDLSGLPPDSADIDSVNFCQDIDTDGIWDPGIEGWGISVPPPFPVTYLTSFRVSESSPRQIFIIFDLSPTATVGNLVGALMLDNTHVTVAAPDMVSNMNFPIETTPYTKILFPSGDITGLVVDTNDEPIEGATIALYNITDAKVNSTVTNETGWFTFYSVNETIDAYSIFAGAAHYENETIEDIHVTQGTLIDIGIIKLKTNVTIEGNVLDEKGQGIENASVSLLDEKKNVIRIVYTNSTGVFVFTGVEYGNYSILVNASGYEGFLSSTNFTIDKSHLNLTIPDISLTAEPPGDGDSGNWWWIIIVAVFIAVLVIVYLFVRKRGKKPEADELEENQTSGEPTSQSD